MKIAILGTGLMGSGLAEGLIHAEHEIIVYNRTAAKTEPLVALGAKLAATAAEAIEFADATILVLADGKAVRETLLNATTRKVLKNKKLLNASTTNPDEMIEIAREVATYEGNLAEISILVGSEQLRTKQGQYLLGCNTAVEAFWSDILHSIGESVYRVGDVGDASKAETPMLFGSMFMSMTVAYSVAMALKLNIPQEIIAQQLAMFAPGAEYMLPNMFTRDYNQCMASVDSFKDVSNTAITTAKSVGVPTKILEDILEVFEKAATRGFAQKDGTAILEVLLEEN